MTRHNSVQEQPVVLDVDSWLYGFVAAEHCGVCTALVAQFETATTHAQRFDTASEIRNHRDRSRC